MHPDLGPDDRRLDPKSVLAGRLGGAIVAGGFTFLSLAAIGLVLGLRTGFRPYWPVVVLFWFVAVAAVWALGLGWPALEYRYTSYRLTEREITIRRGVLWREVVTVPLSRVQHTDLSQGPLSRAFGLAVLTIHTAGTEHAAVALGGLAVGDAARIRDRLLLERGPDAV